MKKQSSRARAQSTPVVRHQLEHPVPTVIHNPEEKMTALGRLTTHAIQEPRRYLTWPTALLGIALVAVVGWKLSSGGSPQKSEVWTKLEAAKNASERVDLAKANPTSPAASWAMIQAATEYYNQALIDLPGNLDEAERTLKKALDLFDQVSREAPHESPLARTAALGRARILEVRNELTKAIEEYERIANDSAWKDTPEAAEAREYAAVLKDPRAVAFYKDLHSFTSPTVTLPPEGTATLPPATLPPGMTPAPPPPSATEKAKAGGSSSSKAPALPAGVNFPGMIKVVEPATGKAAPSAAPKAAPPAGQPRAEPAMPKGPSAPAAAAPTPAEPVKPAAAPKAVEPKKPAETPKPAANTKPSEPAPQPKAAEPKKPSEPAPQLRAAEPKKPSEPAPQPRAAEPKKSNEAAAMPKAAEPKKPASVSPLPKPVEPKKPAEAAPKAKAAEPKKPAEATKPADATKPAASTKPAGSDLPDNVFSPNPR